MPPFAALALVAAAVAPFTQDEAPVQDESPLSQIEWEVGPCESKVGDRATIQVTEGHRFTAGPGARALLEMMENPTSGDELGLILHEGGEGEASYFVVFSFDESGYVKDDDRDELDADALMEAMQAGSEHDNELRRQRGWPTVELAGWQKPPFYDERTNNLTWATLLRSEGNESVNWSTRILGRRGCMSAQLVTGPAELEATLPKFEALMAGFEYVDGERYAQFTAGDKIAEYGLAALVLGGGAAVAAKTGLLAKFWKIIVVGLIAIGAFFKKALGWITGRGRDPEAAAGDGAG